MCDHREQIPTQPNTDKTQKHSIFIECFFVPCLLYLGQEKPTNSGREVIMKHCVQSNDRDATFCLHFVASRQENQAFDGIRYSDATFEAYFVASLQRKCILHAKVVGAETFQQKPGICNEGAEEDQAIDS